MESVQSKMNSLTQGNSRGAHRRTDSAGRAGLYALGFGVLQVAAFDEFVEPHRLETTWTVLGAESALHTLVDLCVVNLLSIEYQNAGGILVQGGIEAIDSGSAKAPTKDDLCGLCSKAPAFPNEFRNVGPYSGAEHSRLLDRVSCNCHETLD